MLSQLFSTLSLDLGFLLVIVLGVSLGLLFTLYLGLSSKYSKLRQKEDKFKGAQDILERARKHEASIIEASYEKASKIIRDAQVFNEDTKKKVLAELEKSVKDISHDIKREALEGVLGFEENLNDQIEVQEIASQRIVFGQIDKTKKEIEDYKAAKLSEVDEKARKIIKDATREILGEAIPLDKHEEMVMKAIENAKRQNIL